MKTIDLHIDVPPNRLMTVQLPTEISPGSHHILVIVDELIDEPSTPSDPYGVCAGQGSAMKLEDFQAERRAMWGRSTDDELERESK